MKTFSVKFWWKDDSIATWEGQAPNEMAAIALAMDAWNFYQCLVTPQHRMEITIVS